MPSFEITGKGIDSGRKRKRVYSAANEGEALQAAEKDGTLVENIVELPPEPPTERQLEYAKDLGLSIPSNATKADLSDLISLKVDRDKPSTSRHREFARRFGIEVTQYVGKKALFNRIQSALVESGRERELLSWFVYRIYRELIGGKDDAPIQSPDDPIIQEIAENLENDEKIIESVRRYEGSELIWFGEWTAPDGYLHSGGSNRTAAYKEASLLLKQKLNFTENLAKKDRSSPKSGKNDGNSKASSRGCLSVIVVVLLIPASLVAYVALA